MRPKDVSVFNRVSDHALIISSMTHFLRDLFQLQEERGIVPPVHDMARPFDRELSKLSLVSEIASGAR